MVFRRQHHQRIELVLGGLDHEMLRDNNCYFGGGTAIALTRGEFRESKDLDFLVSDLDCYQGLRDRVRTAGPSSLFADTRGIGLPPKFIGDQYGLRGWVEVVGSKIKLEIISEGRISFQEPGKDNQIASVAMLTQTDLVAEKLLANSDRFLDTATFSRDLIDLAFMEIESVRTSPAFAKASVAYGDAIVRDLDSAIERFLGDLGWVDRCLAALDISAPRAIVTSLVERLR